MIKEREQYERRLDQQAKHFEDEQKSLRNSLTDTTRELQDTKLKLSNVMHEFEGTRADLDAARDEYQRLQERYHRLGDEFNRFKKNTANPVHGMNISPSKLHSNNHLNFSETTSQAYDNDDGSYLMYAPSRTDTDGYHNQANFDLRKELEKALNTVKEKQSEIDQNSRDKDRLVQDVSYWKKQVDVIREENSTTFQANMSKIESTEFELDKLRKKEKEMKLEMKKVVSECDEAKKYHEVKIREACDLLHKDAVAKLKDNFSTEMEHKEFEHRMQVEELAKNNAEEIDKLVRELDQVKENYV